MSGPPSQRSLVCEEVFDERSQPSEEEVREFAVRIGINPDAESHLLPLAREGLLKPLPKNWKPVYEPETKNYYYFNFKTKQSSWEHPLDNKFRELVKKSRSESLSSAGEEDSKTSIKEELRSFEEAAASVRLDPDTSISIKDSQMDFPSHTVPPLKSALNPLRSKKDDLEGFSLTKEKSKSASGRNELKPVFTPKPLFSQGTRDLSKSSDSSLQKPSKAGWDDLSSYLDDDESEPLQGNFSTKTGTDGKYFTSLDYNMASLDQSVEVSNSSITGRFTVEKVRKIDIDSQTKRLDLDGSGNVYRPTDRLSKSGYAQPEFTLSGGGSVFLKSNKKRIDTLGDAELSKLQTGHDLETDTSNNLYYGVKSIEFGGDESSPRPSKSSIQSLIPFPTTSGSSTRSILRTPQVEKRLWDVDPQHMSVSEKALWKQQELEEEKKSVRFNLDKELNISFKLSDTSDSDLYSEPENIEDDAEELEWNSKGSEELGVDLKLLQKDVKKQQQSVKKEKSLSPLEEWAKDTWFSKKPPLGDIVNDESKVLAKSIDNALLSDYGLHTDSHLLEISTCLENEISETQDMPKISSKTVAEEKKPEAISDPVNMLLGTGSSSDVEEKFNEISAHETLAKEENFDDLVTNPGFRKTISPTFDEEDSTEANLVAAITKKLRSFTTDDQSAIGDIDARDARAREQAFRDWNVKKTDNDMHRPSLSRQQSQQQFQQIKEQIREPAKAEDRDRALREWNVTGLPNASTRSVRSSQKTAITEFQMEKPAITQSEDVGMEGGNSEESQLVSSNEEIINDSFKVAAAAKSFDHKLAVDVEQLKLKYEMHFKEKEEECMVKFDQDQKKLLRDFEEQLQSKIKEETKSKELKYKELISQIERESEAKMRQVREQLEHRQICATQKIQEQHQQALAAQEVENQAAMLRIREQQSAEIKNLREQFQREEEQIRREHQDRVSNLREDRDGKRSKEITDHMRTIEKLRCEKRLLEDKYRTLKEKYIKLKGEVKANIEREKKEQKQKENAQIDGKKGANEASGTDQEVSTSQIQQHSDRSSETDTRPKTMSANSSATSTSLGFQQVQSQTRQQEQVNPVLDPPSPAPNSGSSGLPQGNNDRPGPNFPFLGMSISNPPLQERKFSSNKNVFHTQLPSWSNFANFKAAERNGNIPTSGQEHNWGPQGVGDKTNKFSPLEALRHQLRTLDELEEQFPASSVTDAYLRYPFSNSGSEKLGSAELEFFRHRIHLERDMIRQAKNSLQDQQSEYRTRMNNFQQLQAANVSTSPSATLFQMTKEEQELSDMEAKLRRTHTVLSEKVIQLRHLENSLNRLTAPTMRTEIRGRRTSGVAETRYADKAHVKRHRRWDWKNGGGLVLEDMSDDMSSDSGGSSGFSSTEYTSDGTLASILSHTGSGNRFRKTPEVTADINVSLHNLNAEISEIWHVLCKQRAAAGLGPPPLLSTQSSTWINPATQHVGPTLTSSRSGSPVMMPSLSKMTIDRNSSLIERTNNLRQWLQKAKVNATSPPARDTNGVTF